MSKNVANRDEEGWRMCACSVPNEEMRVCGWYWPLWGCAVDRVEMVVKVHCGTVLGTNLPPCWKCVLKNSPTIYLTTMSPRSPAQPQSGECKPSCLKSLPQTQSCVWINEKDPMEMTVKLSSWYDFSTSSLSLELYRIVHRKKNNRGTVWIETQNRHCIVKT